MGGLASLSTITSSEDKGNGSPLAHITTDKPIYKPNDVAFIEVYAVDLLTKEPARKMKEMYNYRTGHF